MRWWVTLIAFISTLLPAIASDQRQPEWLQKLAEATRDYPIVQLGESGHGVAEFYRTKTDIVRFLHQHQGFDVLAIEGGVAECWVTNERIGQWSADKAMQACLWDAWGGQEAAALFAYIKQTQTTDRPLKLVGFDNLSTSEAFADWLSTEANTQPELLAAERAFIRLMSGQVQSQQEVSDLHKQALSGYRSATGLDENIALLVESRLATLNFDPESLSQQTIGEMRDALMANLVKAHLARHADKKMIIWGHNAHLSHAYSQFNGGVTRQGEILYQTLADKLYTLGIYSGSGSAYAWFTKKEYQHSPLPEQSLEARMLAQPGEVIFMDMQQASASGIGWVNEKVPSLEWGQFEQQIVPAKMYDGLLVIRTVSPLTRTLPAP